MNLSSNSYVPTYRRTDVPTTHSTVLVRREAPRITACFPLTNKPTKESIKHINKKTTMTEASSEEAILTFLSSSPDAVIEDTFPWSASQNLNHAAVVGSVKSLLVEEYVANEALSTSFYSLTEEGESILKDGAQEIVVLKALVEAGKLSMVDLQTKVGKNIAKIGMGNCMKLKWVKKDGADLVPLKQLTEVTDEVQVALIALKEAEYALTGLSDKVNIETACARRTLSRGRACWMIVHSFSYLIVFALSSCARTLSNTKRTPKTSNAEKLSTWSLLSPAKSREAPNMLPNVSKRLPI